MTTLLYLLRLRSPRWLMLDAAFFLLRIVLSRRVDCRQFYDPLLLQYVAAVRVTAWGKQARTKGSK